MTVVGADLIKQEDQKYGVPDWLAFPLIDAESGFQSDAQNGQFQGLLQLQAGYVAAAEQFYPSLSSISGYDALNSGNRMDPQQNLDMGLPPLRAALDVWERNHPGADLSKPNHDAYDYVLTHTGHPTWVGDWAGQQQTFENAYGTYDGSTSSPGTVFGPPLSAAGNAAGSAVKDAFSGLTSIGDLFRWVASHPGTVAVILLALVLFLGVSLHLVTQEVPAV